jgi:hypothetical protein
VSVGNGVGLAPFEDPKSLGVPMQEECWLVSLRKAKSVISNKQPSAIHRQFFLFGLVLSL